MDTNRAHIEKRFIDLGVGQFDEMDGMPTEILDAMVEELESAQVGGLLDLETSDGVDRLEAIVNKHLSTESL